MGRLTIASLMFVIALAAAFMAALKTPSAVAFGVLLVVTIEVLLFAAYRSIVGRTWRWFWVGFACVGAAYLSVTLVPTWEQQVGLRLPTTRLLQDSARLVKPPARPMIWSGQKMDEPDYILTVQHEMDMNTLGKFERAVSGGYIKAVGIDQAYSKKQGRLAGTSVTDLNDYMHIAHVAAALLFALVSGLFAIAIAATLRSMVRRASRTKVGGVIPSS